MPALTPLWNERAPGGNGIVRPGASPIGQDPPVFQPPVLGADQYGDYKKSITRNFDRTRLPPTDFWQSPPRKLQFRTVTQDNAVAVAVWQPPLFDLRPDLMHATGAPSDEAQPIWKDGAYGTGLTLWVFVDNIFLLTEDVAVFAITYGHPFDAPRATRTQLQQPQDITAAFQDGQEGVILSWAFPGYRFWGLKLRFDQLTGTPNQVGTHLNVAAAAY